jgi:hypothetical protein
MATSPPDVTFMRDLIGQRLVAWNALLQRLATVQLSSGPDEFRWNLLKNGEFSVDSMYVWMVSSSRSNPNQRQSCEAELAWESELCFLSS